MTYKITFKEILGLGTLHAAIGVRKKAYNFWVLSVCHKEKSISIITQKHQGLKMRNIY